MKSKNNIGAITNPLWLLLFILAVNKKKGWFSLSIWQWSLTGLEQLSRNTWLLSRWIVHQCNNYQAKRLLQCSMDSNDKTSIKIKLKNRTEGAKMWIHLFRLLSLVPWVIWVSAKYKTEKQNWGRENVNPFISSTFHWSLGSFEFQLTSLHQTLSNIKSNSSQIQKPS